MPKSELKEKIWSKNEYYAEAHKGSLDKRHYGMVLLNELAKKSNNILDLGCGDGTRLKYLAGKRKYGTGIDISPTAIKLAKKKYSSLHFLRGDLEHLPFKDNSFDLVYSAFVLEHLDNPEAVLNEAIRVTAVKGNLVLIAPNYGSPNRASPVFKGSRVRKLIVGFFSDVFRLKDNTLGWSNVVPSVDAYEIDSDTTVEPYLLPLINFLKGKGIKIKEWSVCWEEELSGANILQKFIKFLADFKIYPFNYWGPHLVVRGQKTT